MDCETGPQVNRRLVVLDHCSNLDPVDGGSGHVDRNLTGRNAAVGACRADDEDVGAGAGSHANAEGDLVVAIGDDIGGGDGLVDAPDAAGSVGSGAVLEVARLRALVDWVRRDTDLAPIDGGPVELPGCNGAVLKA